MGDEGKRNGQWPYGENHQIDSIPKPESVLERIGTDPRAGARADGRYLSPREARHSLYFQINGIYKAADRMGRLQQMEKVGAAEREALGLHQEAMMRMASGLSMVAATIPDEVVGERKKEKPARRGAWLLRLLRWLGLLDDE